MVGLYTRQTLKAWHEIIVKPFYARIFQFFGRLQRAWIGVKNLLKYEGVESFEARAENAKLYQGVMKRRLHGAFNPTGNVNLKPLLYHQEFYEPWLLNLEWIFRLLGHIPGFKPHLLPWPNHDDIDNTTKISDQIMKSKCQVNWNV